MSTVHKQAVWKTLPCSKSVLRLDITLVNGQSFRWKETSPGEWRSVLAGKVWTLSQTEDHILYRIESNPDDKHLNTSKDNAHCEAILRDYFQMDVSLSKLYEQWCMADENFKSKASKFTGVRILRQDPVENLFSFICSSCNNIARITQMVNNMCLKFGEAVLEKDEISYHSFPTIDRLASADVEEELKGLGFGYRAKFIHQSAKYIKQNKSDDWLRDLRSRTYEEAKCELMKLPGVGAKVADCVCLMSLDKKEALPIDTHVWQIATRDYKWTNLNKTKSLTDKVYKEIGDRFRELWGEYAGWAQSVMFSAELKKFQETPTETSKRTNKRKSKISKVSENCVKKKKMKKQ